jgi:hypothetical protein
MHSMLYGTNSSVIAEKKFKPRAHFYTYYDLRSFFGATRAVFLALASDLSVIFSHPPFHAQVFK